MKVEVLLNSGDELAHFLCFTLNYMYQYIWHERVLHIFAAFPIIKGLMSL